MRASRRDSSDGNAGQARVSHHRVINSNVRIGANERADVLASPPASGRSGRIYHEGGLARRRVGCVGDNHVGIFGPADER